ncbi:actin cytoskeleton and mitosis protein [Microbotryomycetes sp. JL201]|nr:actin cytoskeleton and mitosis protein [Microbotryomycetes sp. JL201]
MRQLSQPNLDGTSSPSHSNAFSGQPQTSFQVESPHDTAATQSRHAPSLEVLGDDSEARKQRFESSLANNRYLELKPLREAQRQKYIKAGVIPDPTKPMRLDEATNFVGKCTEMCPEWEREEREYQNNVDPLERYPGTTRIDPVRAVKAFHRPAAGNEQPLPEDVRPPAVLKTTLDYLFHQVLPKHPMHVTHPFLRDRTRAVRQDLTMQNVRDASAIECNERIARYHVLSIGTMREQLSFSESQELEQLRKVLKSLNEFYDDARLMNPPIPTPNEAEFRAYNILTHLRDPDIIWSCESLPDAVFDNPLFQRSLQLHRLAQRANMSRGERASLNAYARFFKLVASPQTPFLFGCILSTHFSDIRINALEAMRSAYLQQHSLLTAKTIARVLGCDDEAEALSICDDLSIASKISDGGRTLIEIHRSSSMTRGTIKPHNSIRLVEAKRGTASYADIIDGKAKATPMGESAASLFNPASPSPSAPTTPARQARKLSAAAVPFQPVPTLAAETAATVPKHSFSFGPTKQSLPSRVLPKSDPATPAFTFSAPLQPQPMQTFAPLLRASTREQQSTVPRPSPQATSISVVAPDTATTQSATDAASVLPVQSSPGRQKRPSLKPAETIPHRPKAVVDLKPIVQRLTRALTDELVRDTVQQSTKRAAELALKEVWDLVAMEKGRARQKIAQAITDDVISRAIRRSIAEEAFIALRRRRATIRHVFDNWKRSAGETRARRLAEEARLRHFSAIARQIGPALEVEDEIMDYESEDEDGGPVTKTAIASALTTETLGEDDSRVLRRVQQSSKQRQAVWQPGRWFDALQRQVGQQVANPVTQWDVIFDAGRGTSSVLKWLACKLNLEDDAALIRSGGRKCRIHLINQGKHGTQQFGHVGLVVLVLSGDNSSEEHHQAKQSLSDLALSIDKHSVYACDLLVVDVVSGAEVGGRNRKVILDVLEDIRFRTVRIVELTLETADKKFGLELALLPPPTIRSERWQQPLSLLLEPSVKLVLEAVGSVHLSVPDVLVLQRFCDLLSVVESEGNARIDSRLDVVPDLTTHVSVREAARVLVASQNLGSFVLSLELAQWPPATERRLAVVALEGIASELLRVSAQFTMPRNMIENDSRQLTMDMSSKIDSTVRTLADVSAKERDLNSGKKRKASASRDDDFSPRKQAQRYAMVDVEANTITSALSEPAQTGADRLAALTSLMRETSQLLTERT